MRNRQFLMCLLLLLSATAFGCAKFWMSAGSPPTNTIIVVTPTPPVDVKAEEPPPPPPTSPEPEPSLNPNLSKADVELIAAVKSENIEEVKQLLANGADPDSFFKVSDESLLSYYETVLGLAVDKKNADIVQVLLKKGANVDKHSFDGNQPPVLRQDNFSSATGNEDVRTMKLLIDYHADLTGSKDSPPVITSVKNIEILDFLMKRGFDINAKDFEGRSILIKAIFGSKTELVKAILKYNPDLNQKTEKLPFTGYKELTLLQLAKTNGNKEIVRELKKAGANK